MDLSHQPPITLRLRFGCRQRNWWHYLRLVRKNQIRLHLNQRRTAKLRSRIVKVAKRSEGICLTLRRSLELRRLKLFSRPRRKRVLATLPNCLTVSRRSLRSAKLLHSSIDSDLDSLHHLYDPGLLTVLVD